MFKRFQGEDPGDDTLLDTRRREASRAEDLVCIRCATPITDATERTERGGQHIHVCTNPHEITFRFGCFAHAKGCSETGALTADHSWFAGYHWRLALCRSCGTHLGWLFQNRGNDRFFGLILARLREA